MPIRNHLVAGISLVWLCAGMGCGSDETSAAGDAATGGSTAVGATGGGGSATGVDSGSATRGGGGGTSASDAGSGAGEAAAGSSNSGGASVDGGTGGNDAGAGTAEAGTGGSNGTDGGLTDSSSSADGSVSDAAWTDAADARTDAAALCSTVTFVNAAITETCATPLLQPIGAGGTIPDGIYDATSVTRYELICLSSLPTGRETIKVSGTTLERVAESSDGYTNTSGTLAYVTQGLGANTSLTLTQTCPTAQSAREFGYTISGTTLTIIDKNSSPVEVHVFQKR